MEEPQEDQLSALNFEYLSKLEKSFAIPVQVEKVKYEGDDSTKRDLLDFITSPVTKARNMAELISIMRWLANTLNRYNQYQSVGLSLWPYDEKSEVPNNKLRMDLHLESRRPQVFFGGEVSQNGPMMSANFVIYNAFKRWETLKFSASGWFNTLSGSISLNKPLIKQQMETDYSLIKQTQLFKESSYTEHSTGITTKVTKGNHSFFYNGMWRTVVPDYKGSPEVKTSGGDSFKSSLTYLFNYDRRYNPLLPVEGHAFQFSNELAGLGGDVQHNKTEASLSYGLNFWKDRLCLSLHLFAGALIPFKSPSRINDRFFIGGFTAAPLRGFRYKRVGPQTSTDVLGGDLYYAGGIHLSAPIDSEILPLPLYLQTFLNFGNLVRWNSQLNAAGNLKNLFSEEVRSSVGVGCGWVLPNGIGRIEANYCLPLRTFGYDQIQKFQFGVLIRM